MVPLYVRQIRGKPANDADAALGRAQFQAARDLFDNRRERHQIGRRDMFVQLDAGQR